MGSQLIVAVIVEALDGSVLDRPVHPLDLAIRPRMVRLGQTVLDPVRLADHVEAHRPRVDGVPVPRLLGELDDIVSQNRVDLVGHGFEHVLKEFPGRLSVGCRNELSDGELGSAVDTDEGKELALGRLHFRDVDVEEPDRIALELLSLGLVTLDIRQARDAMTLQTPMERRPCQVRDGGLQGIEAVVQREKRVAPERHDRSFLVLGQDRRARFPRPGLQVLDRRTLAPFRDGLGIDA